MGSKLNFTCPHCGFQYKDLRTGHTYRDIYVLLWVASEDSSKWRYKRRHTILGKWHQLKMELWNEHIWACEALAKMGAKVARRKRA